LLALRFLALIWRRWRFLHLKLQSIG
jgi:hypothetical protein